VRAIFCGVRGSTAAPGPEFVRIGGHTSCLALAHGATGLPCLVLDAGTGIRRVSGLLGGAAFRGTIALTHLHWDHVQGLPFFAAGDRHDAAVRLAMPAQGDPRAVLARAMAPPHFPITPAGLRGAWSFEAWEPGVHEVEGFEVLALEVPHKGGRTFGYRVTAPEGGRSLAYVPDHEPRAYGEGPDGLGARHEAVMRLVKGVDLLVHGAPFTRGQRRQAAEFGHATVDYAVALAVEAEVGRLALFHHAPDRTDDEVDALVRSSAGAAAGPAVPVVAAAEGLALDL
jgi:ribonuclease BN (tRNA processing enzyme)